MVTGTGLKHKQWLGFAVESAPLPRGLDTYGLA